MFPSHHLLKLIILLAMQVDFTGEVAVKPRYLIHIFVIKLASYNCFTVPTTLLYLTSAKSLICANELDALLFGALELNHF